MTRLRICIGLIASALLVGVIPAHAGTTFRTAKVCAQTESGISIAGVTFRWIYPGTVGGSGTTDRKGCFTAEYVPVGNVTFTTKGFSISELEAPLEKLVFFHEQSIQVSVTQSGSVLLRFPQILPTQKLVLTTQEPDGNTIPSTFYVSPRRNIYCNPRDWSKAEDNQLIQSSFLYTNQDLSVPATKIEDGQDYPFTEFISFAQMVGWTFSVDTPNQVGGLGQYWYAKDGVQINQLPTASVTLKFFNLSNKNRSVGTCIRSSNGAEVAFLWVTDAGPYRMTYENYLEGFRGLPAIARTKNGKLTLTPILHGNHNQPISGIPVTVSEPKATNPNIGKKVGTCKPLLTATTNSQGRATFTLCPTKNTTVTVKAPPLGIVSQSITVTK